MSHTTARLLTHSMTRSTLSTPRAAFSFATLPLNDSRAIRAALLGRFSVDLYAPADWPVFLERRCRALRGEPVAPFLEATLYRADGMPIPVELSITNYLQGEAIAGRIVVVRDIQLRKRTEAQPGE